MFAAIVRCHEKCVCIQKKKKSRSTLLCYNWTLLKSYLKSGFTTQRTTCGQSQIIDWFSTQKHFVDSFHGDSRDGVRGNRVVKHKCKTQGYVEILKPH